MESQAIQLAAAFGLGAAVAVAVMKFVWPKVAAKFQKAKDVVNAAVSAAQGAAAAGQDAAAK